MTASKAQQAEVAHRRAQLLKLRRQGIRYSDDRVLNLGYGSPAAARRDLVRALEQNRDEEAAEASVYRQQENERLDELLEAAWPQATERQPIFDKQGEVIGHGVDMRAVDTVLRLMDRRAKLNGLDMPAKAEVTGANGGPLQLGPATSAELEALIGLGPAPAATEEDPVDPQPGDDQADSGSE